MPVFFKSVLVEQIDQRYMCAVTIIFLLNFYTSTSFIFLYRCFNNLEMTSCKHGFYCLQTYDQVLFKCVLILFFPVYDIHTCVLMNFRRLKTSWKIHMSETLMSLAMPERGKYIQMSKIGYFALTLQSIPISFFFLLITQLFWFIN